MTKYVVTNKFGTVVDTTRSLAEAKSLKDRNPGSQIKEIDKKRAPRSSKPWTHFGSK